MLKADETRFVTCLTVLMKAYGVVLDKLDYAAWLQDLQDLPIEAVEQSCATLRRAAKATDFPARPGDVRILAEDWVRYVAEKASSKRLLLEDAGARDFSGDPRLYDVTRGHFSGKCRSGCVVCAREKQHPKPHLHFRGRADLVAGDIDWANDRVEGCCAVAVPKAEPRDWLDALEQRQEER